MHNQGAHIITHCQWNTAFDSKRLAHQLQMDISSWSSYKMKRIIDTVFDSICPQGQTLKIKKLAIDLGAITYENMMSELPLRLEEALRTALYDLIMYPKNGDKTLEIIHEDIAQINVLRDFLLQGILPWNYQETYGTAAEIMRSQLVNNRLDVVHMIQEIGISANVRKRIAWQFSDVIIKKIIAGLEPNNHQQIISFSKEFVKVQEKETIVQTSTNDLKKNLWLWILNYLFTDRGTIFNRVAFVRNTIEQMASHFNISYDAMIELIESAIGRANEYFQVDKGFIAILNILSEELHNTSFSRIKTEKQKENFWQKVELYFNSPTTRSINVQKNEFNELVINLSKLDTTRFQKIVLSVPQKPSVWKAVLKDLIPAAIESLFVALAPSQSKKILTEITFLEKLHKSSSVKIELLDVYTFGIEFCVTHQHTSIGKTAFLDFVIEKLAHKQQQSKFVILDHFVASNVANTEKKTSFISLYSDLQSLYQKEIATAKAFTSEKKIQHIISKYISEIQQPTSATSTILELEKIVQKWILASPTTFWNAIISVEKTQKVTIHITALIASYGTERFLKAVAPENFTVLVKVKQLIEILITKHPKKAPALRAIKNALMSAGFEVLWKYKSQNAATFFTNILQYFIQQQNILKVSSTAVKEAIQLVLNTPKIRTLAWSSHEFVSIQAQHKKYTSQTTIEVILELTTQAKKQVEVAKHVSQLVRSKKTTTSKFKANETTIISYLVTNGIQLRGRLIAKFLKQITETKTTFSSSQIKVILQDCFWQSLVHYQSYQGNERAFTQLFEATVLETFPAINTIIEKAEITKNSATKKLQKNEVIIKPYQIETNTLFEVLKDNLQATNTTVEISKRPFSFATLFVMGLETSPKNIRNIIVETVTSSKQLSFLKETIKFEEFIVLIGNDVASSNSAVFRAIHMLFVIAKQLGNTQTIITLQTIFWEQTIAIIQRKHAAKKVLKTLVNISFDTLSETATLDQITIVKHIQNNRFKVPEILKTVLVERHQIFELATPEIKEFTLSEALTHCVEHNKLELLSKHLITRFSIPTWFQHQEAHTYQSIVNELIQQQPLIVLKTIRSQQISTVQLTKFVQTIHFKNFIEAVLKLYPSQRKELMDMQKLYESIAFVSMRGISTKSLQEIIVKKVITAWQTSNWSLITHTNIWNELLWETCGKQHIQQQDFINAINTIKTMLPPSLQVTYTSISSIIKPSKHNQSNIEYHNKKKSFMETELREFPEEGVAIPNAGLVMLNSYFLMLLDRLDLTENNAFISDEAQLDSIHYLQFIVTGLTQTDESLLTLNKVLVGLSPNTPVKDSTEITEDQKQLIEGMLQAAISYWPEIGQTSINGFRGNWLVRDGILRETEDRWELTVEKRPYDVLMMKSPFSFSIIKLPWMSKPLHVTWPF
ncbi:contractile injection system tape measure protein [Kordia sp.]|uniref:contractile injection system tape measure protein n=1 Tax=Kordia sp. TaxID=1965332 RepID=UPI003B5991C7